MAVFGSETVTPQNLNNAVGLKKGNIEGVPQSRVLLQNTSPGDWDKLRFNFLLNGLQKSDAQGNVSGMKLSIDIKVYNSWRSILNRYYLDLK